MRLISLFNGKPGRSCNYILPLIIIIACYSFSCKGPKSSSMGPSDQNNLSASPKNISDASQWANPFIIISADKLIIMYHTSTIEQKQLSIDDLPAFLRSLPPECWPYGKVVAVQESGVSAPTMINESKDRKDSVIKILSDMGIKVNHWPSA
jgi:hypothetical protein